MQSISFIAGNAFSATAMPFKFLSFGQHPASLSTITTKAKAMPHNKSFKSPLRGWDGPNRAAP